MQFARYLSIFFALVFILMTNAQEYERTWGTYLGPAGSEGSQNYSYIKLKFDPVGNFSFFGQVKTNSNYTNSYYNQFATSGNGYDTSQWSNYFFANIGASGNILSLKYENLNNYNVPNFSFDSAGNRFALQYNFAGITATGTPGTWNPTGIGNENKTLISKYNTSSVLQWQTFVESNVHPANVVHDELGNTYISASTLKQTGFTTSGVFLENFEVLYDNNGNVLPNNYLVKLDANGALVWATYFPTDILCLKYYSGNLYVLGGSDNNPNASTLATPNAFQSQKALSSLTKINANSGNRIWGTYYGTPVSSTFQLSNTIEVNDSGIYLVGDIYDYSGTNIAYFGTAGSHQPTATGASDVYLTKFSHSGTRLWSTYFGSPGEEYSSFSNSPMALIGNDIIITLFQYSTNGSTNLATPGAYISSMPTSSYPNGSANLLFAKFNSSGVLQWSSYYGGASINNTFNPTISVAAKSANTFYLYGATLADTGITTPGAAQTAKIPNERTGFVARFDLKNSEMSTTETDITKDLILYDNPNNGNFYISGTVLREQHCILQIYDLSGKLIYQDPLPKNQKQFFALQDRLTSGNYMLKLTNKQNQLIKTFKLIVNRE